MSAKPFYTGTYAPLEATSRLPKFTYSKVGAVEAAVQPPAAEWFDALSVPSAAAPARDADSVRDAPPAQELGSCEPPTAEAAPAMSTCAVEDGPQASKAEPAAAASFPVSDVAAASNEENSRCSSSFSGAAAVSSHSSSDESVAPEPPLVNGCD